MSSSPENNQEQLYRAINSARNIQISVEATRAIVGRDHVALNLVCHNANMLSVEPTEVPGLLGSEYARIVELNSYNDEDYLTAKVDLYKDGSPFALEGDLEAMTGWLHDVEEIEDEEAASSMASSTSNSYEVVAFMGGGILPVAIHEIEIASYGYNLKALFEDADRPQSPELSSANCGLVIKALAELEVVTVQHIRDIV